MIENQQLVRTEAAQMCNGCRVRAVVGQRPDYPLPNAFLYKRSRLRETAGDNVVGHGWGPVRFNTFMITPSYARQPRATASEDRLCANSSPAPRLV